MMLNYFPHICGKAACSSAGCVRRCSGLPACWERNLCACDAEDREKKSGHVGGSRRGPLDSAVMLTGAAVLSFHSDITCKIKIRGMA